MEGWALRGPWTVWASGEFRTLPGRAVVDDASLRARAAKSLVGLAV